MNHNRAQQVNANSSAIAKYSSTRGFPFSLHLAAGNVAGPSLVPMRSLRWEGERRRTSASVKTPETADTAGHTAESSVGGPALPKCSPAGQAEVGRAPCEPWA